MKNLQMSVFHNDGTLIVVHKIEHCDIVKSHSIFYMVNPRMSENGVKHPWHYDETSVFRCTQGLRSMSLINGKIILYYSTSFIEIIRY